MPLWIRSLYTTILMPGMVAGVLPWWVGRGMWRLPLPLGPARWLGLPAFAAGLFLLFATIWDFGAKGKGTLAPWDPPRELVHQNLYRWVRNPMYLGVLCCILGQALFWSSGGVLAYLGAIALIFHIRVVAFEEPFLAREFGSQYAGYLKTVPRWIPRPPRPV